MMIMNKKMILALSWRDLQSPKSGGAEVHTYNLILSYEYTKLKDYL